MKRAKRESKCQAKGGIRKRTALPFRQRGGGVGVNEELDGRKRIGRSFVIAGLMFAIAIGVAACGGSSGSSSEATSTEGATSSKEGATSTASNQKVKTLLAEAKGPVKWEGPTEPSPAVPNKNVTAVVTFEAAEGILIADEGMEAAAKAIGWNLTIIDGKGTTQGYAAGISQAITENAEAVILFSITPSLIPNQMKQLKAAHIPVIALSNVEEPTEELWIANVGYEPKKEAEFLAAQLTEESGGDAQVLTVNEPAAGVVQTRLEYFKEALAELCPGCNIAAETEFSVAELETKLGPKIGALLQANPNVNYVYAPYDAAVPPMIAAIKQGGLENDVKIVSYGGFRQNIEYLRNKEIQTATVANATQWQGWETIDALNRYFNEKELTPTVLHSDPFVLLTWDEVPPPGQYFEGNEANYQQHYEELWGVSK